MWVEQFALEDYRNYVALVEDLGRGGVVLLGANAQGKTNCLEALAVLATGQSHREGRASNLIRHGCAEGRLRATVVHAGGQRIEPAVRLARDGRAFSINGLPCERLEEYLGACNVMVFHAGDVELVAGPAALRRRHLNEEIAKRNPLYLTRLASYRRHLAQRNAALKQAVGPRGMALVESYTDGLVRLGEEVMAARVEHIERVGPLAGEVHSRLSGGKERLRVRYAATAGPGHLAAELARLAADEVRRGVTLAGPHRDDVSLELNGRSLRTAGSRGQQKSAALAWKLAEAHAAGADPAVPLLDDVMSELDRDRRLRLGEELSVFDQYLVTGTQEADVADNVLAASEIRYVREGRLGRE